MNPKRGELWLVDLGQTMGDEMRKVRPAIIVSSDEVGVLALRVVVPITGWHDRFGIRDWMTRVDPDSTNNLDKPSAADAFQIRSVALARFVRQIGEISSDDLARVINAVKAVFEF